MKFFSRMSHIISFLIVLPSCVYRNMPRQVHRTHTTTPIYLKMPQNSSVHQNHGPLLYQALFTRLQRIGYPLLDCHTEAAYVLTTKVSALRHPEKLISPDVVLYGYRSIIVVECVLSMPDGNKNEVKKTFSLPILISNPKNPMLGSHFLLSTTKDQLEHVVTPIIQWIEQMTMTPPCR